MRSYSGQLRGLCKVLEGQLRRLVESTGETTQMVLGVLVRKTQRALWVLQMLYTVKTS